MEYILLFFIAGLGWLFFYKIRMPSAPMIGSMFGVGLAKIFGIGLATMPNWTMVISQIILGLLIGLKIEKDKFIIFRSYALPAGLVVAWAITSTTLLGWLLISISNFSISTALLGVTPGGLVEMSILALAFEADVPTVALLQLLRFVVILISVPLIASNVSSESVVKDSISAAKEEITYFAVDNVWFVISGVLVGITLYYLNFPVGGFVGSLLGSGFIKIFKPKAVGLSDTWFNLAQAGLGIIIGLKFSSVMVEEILQMALVLLLFSAAMIFSGIVLALVLKKITGWELTTCLLASAPGGMAQMSVIGEALGCDTLKISLLQLVRLLTIFLLMPILLNWYLG